MTKETSVQPIQIKAELRVKDLKKSYRHWYYVVEYEGGEYDIKLFDFQKEQGLLPQAIKCIIKKKGGETAIQQDMVPLIASRYKVGDIRNLTIRTSQERSGQYDAYTPEGFRFHFNNTRNKSYPERQVVTCRIVSIYGIKVNVEEAESVKPSEDFATAMITPEALQSTVCASHIDGAVVRLMVKVFKSDPRFHIARQSLKNGQPQWLTETVEVISGHMGQWLTVGLDTRPKANHRKLILKELKRTCIDLVERSGLVAGDSDCVRQMREALSGCIGRAEEFRTAITMLKDKTKDGVAIDSYKSDILSSLERTGYVYEASRRLGVLTCAMTVDETTMDDVIHQVFNILSSRPCSDWSSAPLRTALVRMLTNYADVMAGRADRVMNLDLGDNKAVVSDVVSALAFVMLLTESGDGDVNRHAVMSRLCRYASLFQKNLGQSLNNKAYGNLLSAAEIKLPLSWPDMKSSSDVLCFKLSQTNTPAASDEPRLFEGRRLKVSVAGDKIRIEPAQSRNQLRDALPEGLPGWRDVTVKVGSRDYVRPVKADTDNIQELKLMWRDVEDGLLDTQDEAHKQAQAVIPRKTKLPVEKGDEVLIRITGASGSYDKSGNPLFRCSVVDEHLRGEGLISPRSIVHYNVQHAQYHHFLNEEGKPMLLKARVCNTDVEGAYEFDILKLMGEFVSQYAHEGDELCCQMTIANQYGNLLISELGYSLKVPMGKDTPVLKNGDLVIVQTTKVHPNGNVDAQFVEFASGEDLKMKETFDEDSFHDLLINYSEGKTYNEEYNDATETEDREEEEEMDRDELSRDEVGELMNIMDRQSAMASSRAQTFNLLALARLLAIAIDDDAKVVEFHERMSLIAMMDGYARNQWVDPGDFDRHYNRIIDLLAGNPDLQDNAMRLFCLSRLERAGQEARILEVAEQRAGTLTGSIARLVLAFNMADDQGLLQARRDIRNRINELLGVKTCDESEREYMGEEGPSLEFKESLVFPPDNNMKPDPNRQGLKILSVVCGMLNAKGGRVLIGVNDSGLAMGCAPDFSWFSGTDNYDEQKARDKMSLAFTNLMRQHMHSTASLYVDTFFEVHGGRKVFVIEVTKPSPTVMDVDGKCYRRIGSATHMMDDDEIRSVRELKSHMAEK